MEAQFAPLIKFLRNNLSEKEHNGLIFLLDKNAIIKKIGEDNGYAFYHRSCMKPLQASVLIDFSVDEKYNLSLEEIAIASASHCGSDIHIKTVLSLLKKIGLDSSYLKCPPHKPLSVEAQKNLILSEENYTALHNNCSGKHAAMLALCVAMGWDTQNYIDAGHPLNRSVIKRVEELCETENSIISKDGCGLPTVATTLNSLGKGFLNLFLDKKYDKLKRAFIEYPYFIGGDLRLDTEVIKASEANLIAKVGACGLCTVVNLQKEQCLVVKIQDTDMEARSLVVIESLRQLGWLDDSKIRNSSLNKLFNTRIETLLGEVVGHVEFSFSF